MRILTNFLNAPERLDGGGVEAVTVLRHARWEDVRPRLRAANLVVIDCRDWLLYRIAAHFLLFPWNRRPLVAVDLVLRRPVGVRGRLGAWIKRRLFGRVTHFIHYFRDLSGYTRYFGIRPECSSYVPFKVNSRDVPLAPGELREEYVFTLGRSLRDYDTYIRAVAGLPYPAAIPAFSFESFEGRGRDFPWTRENLPPQLTVLPDSGRREDLIRNLARARVVVIPTQASSLCASGLSTYLDAMFLGKCVIISHGPGATDLLTDQARLVPAHDVTALQQAIREVWEDGALRARIGAAGRAYAVSLGGERELLERIFACALRGPTAP